MNKCCYKLPLIDRKCNECGHYFPPPSRTWNLLDFEKVDKASKKLVKLARKSTDPATQKQSAIVDYYSTPLETRKGSP